MSKEDLGRDLCSFLLLEMYLLYFLSKQEPRHEHKIDNLYLDTKCSNLKT